MPRNRHLSSRRALAACTAVVAAGAVATVAPSGPAVAAPAQSQLARMVAGMTLAEKVGQLFVTYAYGATATSEAPGDVQANQQAYGVDNGAQLVAKYHLGGVIYFTWSGNLSDPTQVAGLSNGLQQAATTTGGHIPLLISTDQEGGNVVRLNSPVAVSPGNMALGASFDPSVAGAAYRATGQQLGALGINVDDAPVVDTNTNPNNSADGPRSFGDDPGQTSAFAAAAVTGLQGAGVAATAKHFPGLGSTTVNTDFGEAVTDETRADFDRYDLPAFRAAIAAGTDEIMAAHIVAPALDPSGKPASLSNAMVTGLLRRQLGYQGLVVTDALSAAALHDYSDAQRAVLAVQAGDDQLLMPTDLAASIQAVIDAVRSDEIGVGRIDQSVTRILTLKQRLGLFSDNQVDVEAAATAVGTPAQNAAMTTAAARGVTLYRNSDGTLPLTPSPDRKVLVTGWGASTGRTLLADLSAEGVQATRVYTGSAPSQATIDQAVAAAKQSDDVLVVTDNAWADPGQRDLVRQLQNTGTPVIVLAVGAPYELGFQPDTPTFLASFGYQPASLQAVTDVVFGQGPSGRSPVTIRTPDGSQVVAPLGSGTGY